MSEKRKGFVIWFGLGGHVIEAINCHLSGYERPESFEARVEKGDYEDYDLEGAFVINKREILQEKPHLCLKGPLVDCKIESDTYIDRCPEPSPIFAGAVKGNEFGTLLAMQQLGYGKEKPSDPGPLDSVSPKAYAEWWKKHGASVGKFIGGKIVWDEVTANE
jgi:hypothetical protein